MWVILNLSILVVDSLKPTELTVSFSSLSHWPDTPPAPPKDEMSKFDLKAAKAKDKDKDSKFEVMTVESSSVLEGGNTGLYEHFMSNGW